MTFEELLKMQSDLNSLAATPPDQVFEGRILTALFVECGEALQTIKYVWAWWTRHGKKFEPPSKAQLLGELADVFHFLLTLCLVMPDAFDQDNLIACYEERLWAEGLGARPPSIDLYMVFLEAERFNLDDAVEHFVSATRKLGFTREELEQAYRNKAQENIMRFTQTVEANA